MLQIGVNNKDFKKYKEICRKYSNKRLINTKNILIESFKGNPLLNEIFGNKTTFIKNNDSLTHNSSSINKSYQKKINFRFLFIYTLLFHNKINKIYNIYNNK